MIEGVKNYFLHRFADAPVEIREKAKMFLYLITSTLVFLWGILIVLNFTMDLFMTNLILMGLGLGLLISLLFLRRGRYYWAVNFFSLMCAAAVIFLGFYGQLGRERPDYITNFYYYPLIIVYTALFCRRRWIFFITFLLVASGSISYILYLRDPLGEYFTPVAQGALVDYTGSAVLTLVLCFTIIMINRRVTEAARREERDRELHAELEMARLIQSNLMPAGPADDPRIAVCATYMPMEEIGGDFYDFYTSGDDLHVFIADVSGHGIPGAFMALITKVALLHSIGAAGSTTEVLQRINQVLCDSTVLGNFVSCFYCRIDKAARKISYTSAGHIPQFLYRRRDKCFREFYLKGTVLGWSKDIILLEETIDLESGDRLVLFTDGVTECMNSSREMYTNEKLCAFIAEQGDLPAEEFSLKLLRDLVEFSKNEKFHDDLTLITIDIK